MFYHDAAVHDYYETGGLGFFRSFFIDYPFLHPEHSGFNGYGLIGNNRDIFGAAEYIDDIHLVRDIQ
jgi:hypothetical protein